MTIASDSVKKTKYTLFRVMALAVFAVVGFASLIWHRAGHAENAAADRRVTVAVARAELTDLQQELELPGEFRPFQEVDIDTKVKGYIKSLPVDVGSRVKPGELLAQLEVPEAEENLHKGAAAVERAKNRAAQSQALANDAKEMFDRLAGVGKERPDLVAQQDLDQAKAKADAANAAAIADRSAVIEAEAQLREWRDIVGYEKIVAPFAGVITKLYANLGALVGDGGNRGDHANSSLMHIAQLDRLRLIIKIPESAVPLVHEGSQVIVSIPALEKNAELTISRMSHDIDLSTRTMHVEVDYPNIDTAVTPGLFADIRLPIATHVHVTAVPVQALNARRDEKAKIYVLRSDGTIEPRSVTLGLVTATQAEISEGVKPDEMVVMGSPPQHAAGILFAPQLIATKE